MIRRQPFSGVLVFSSLFLLAGCTETEPELPTSEVLDSSGVRVVISHSPQGFETPWTLSEEPILRIGKGREEEPYLFRAIGSAVRLGDGSVVVLDRAIREMRRFDEQGNHLVTFGGSGGGPGEFRSIRARIERFGDTLLVLDSDGSVARFDPNGRLLGEIPVDGLRAGGGSLNGRWQGVLPSGELWGSRYPLPPEPPMYEVFRDPFVVVVSDLDRTEVRTIGEFLGQAQFTTQDFGIYHPVFNTHMVPNRDPVGLLVADSETFTIDLFHSTGRHLQRMEYPRGVRETDSEMVNRWKRALLEWTEASAEGQPEDVMRTFRRWLAELPSPEVWPGFNWVIGDEDGYTWAFEYLPTDQLFPTYGLEPDGSRMAWVFHPEGYLLGSVEIPAKLTPFEIGPDYVLGLVRDTLGVNEVVLYGLTGR